LLVFFAGAAACQGADVPRRFDAGLDLLYENRFEDAEAHFLALARDMDRSALPDAAAWRARALFQVGRIDHLYLGQPNRAIARLREALKADPAAAFAFEARQEIGDIFHDRLQDYRSAALEYERLLSEFPMHPSVAEFHYRIAQCYFLLSEHDQARTEARLMLQKQPDSGYAAEARLLIANSYYVEGKLAEAVQAHQEFLATAPEASLRARSQFELGLCHQDLGDAVQAERVYLLALKDHPRPDLVQQQLTALRVRQREGSEGARPLSSPVAGAQPATLPPRPGEPTRTALPPSKPGEERVLTPPQNYRPKKDESDKPEGKAPEERTDPAGTSAPTEEERSSP
jgi:tetratricopeptide (TPR) repeat protein